MKEGILSLINDKRLVNDKSFIQKIGMNLQFQNYGLNQTGKLSTKDIKLIKKLAIKNDIKIVDTANVYGDSEKRLGQIDFSKFKLVSKLPGLAPKSKRYEWVLSSLKSTLKKLNVKKIYGLHVHSTKFLLDKRGHSIYKGLLKAKKLGLIKKIGGKFCLYG